MQAKCWPYLRYRANSQCTRVCHTTLPPYHVASRSGSVLSIYSHPHQPRDTNQHDWNFPCVTDRIDRMCSVRILSADTTQRPWALLLMDGGITLTHWGWVMHICVSRLTIIGSDNGLSPGQCQAIIWTNAAIVLIWPVGTNFSEISIKIHIFSFNEMHMNMLSAKCRPLCLSLNVLKPV